MALVLAGGSIVAGGIIGLACGLDEVGQLEAPVQAGDAAPQLEASVPARLDAESYAAADAADAADATAAACPSLHGPMVVVDAGGLVFCVDATEVTNREYDSFLSATDGGAARAFDAGAPGCAANTSFARVGVSVVDSGAADAAAFPASRIDWCDAYSYCAWAGKRLCGKTTAGDASTGEWFAACSNGGTRTHAYGNGYVAKACNEDTGGVRLPVAVGTFPGCEGGVPGVFDMNGNVSEMIDNCGPAGCSAVGGSYFASTTGCAVVQSVAKIAPGSEERGFRCCADTR
jgi:formylglycine-generating enzyme required for sulfatase activity